MRHKPFFKFVCTLVLWFFSTATMQAGQVITREERDWAKKMRAQEAALDSIASSKSLAVLNFHNKTGQQRLDPLQKGLALMLITDLSKIEDIIVVERIRMQALVDEMKLGETGLVEPETAPQVGKLLQAYYLVNGDIRTGATQPLQLQATLLDVPFEILNALPPASGSLEELFRLEKDLLFDIVEELNLYISPQKRQELEQPLSTSSAALLALFMGIDHSDKGNYQEAAEMYERALAEDPNLRLAGDALQELQNMGLTDSQDVSRIEPESEVPPVEEGGIGIGTVMGVGLVLALIGGGAALLASSSSSDDDDQPAAPTGLDPVSPTQTSPAAPTGLDPVSPTEEAPTASLRNSNQPRACLSDRLEFTFSAPMDTSRRSFTVTSPPMTNIYEGFSGNTWVITWDNSPDHCYNLWEQYGPEFTLGIRLNNFYSRAGMQLGEPTSFNILVRYNFID